MRLKKFDIFKISQHLKYHIENGLTLSECIFRYGSDAHLEILNETRNLYIEGKIELSEPDQFIIEKLKTGQKGFYKGREVVLDLPDRNTTIKDKKFRVFTDSGKKDEEGNIIAIKHEWGAKGYKVSNSDDVARKSFLARHGCHTKPEAKDPINKIFWVCNVAIFWKQLNLTSDKEW